MDETKRKRDSHIWARETNEWYQEPAWCSRRLFQVEDFDGPVEDPCCGGGTIPKEAIRHGVYVTAADIVDRGYPGTVVRDFFKTDTLHINIVCNPPFDIAKEFTLHALSLACRKVAIIFPTARLNAARWMQGLPLRRIWLLTPRPSMPPGHVIAAGQKPGGGKMDFCWAVFEQRFIGQPEIRWLHRDGDTEQAA